jgi:hypothetical protein
MYSNTGEWTIPQTVSLPSAWTLTKRAAREVWRYLPAWMFLIYGCLLLNTELTNFEPARHDLAYTAIFPLSVFVLFYVVRSLKAPDVTYRALMLASTLGLAVVLPLLNLAYHRPSPLSITSLRYVYELSNFAWAALMLGHALKRRPTHAVLFFGAGMLYGACLENGGIVLGFFSEQHLTATMVRPFVAPIATMVGWCVVLYMAVFVVWGLRSYLPSLRRSAALSALTVGVVATFLDLQIDPVATAVGCWVWQSSLQGWFHGVPLLNFVAWVIALSSFAYVMFRYQDREGICDGDEWNRKHLTFAFASVPAVLIIAAAAFATTMLLLEGPHGPAWTILYRFVETGAAWVSGPLAAL